MHHASTTFTTPRHGVSIMTGEMTIGVRTSAEITAIANTEARQR